MTRQNRFGCGSNRHPYRLFLSGVNGSTAVSRGASWSLCAIVILLATFALAQNPATPAVPTQTPQAVPSDPAGTPPQQTDQQRIDPSRGGPATDPAVAPQSTASPAQQPPPAQQSPATQQPKKTEAEPPSSFEEIHVQPRSMPEKKDRNADIVEPAPGADDPSLKTHTKPMKVDVDLVLVPVTVTDPMNRLVTGLEKDNFVVMDGGEKQEVRHFSSEDAPISLGVIFDMSGSMKDKIDKSREAVVEFFKTANPEDEFFMIAFNDKPELVADFTQSVEDIQGRLVYTVPQGRTALMDAIYLGLAKMRNARHQKKALLIISDGGDNHSRYTENEIKSLVKEADVQIYAIGIYSPMPGTEEERTGPTTLSEITDVTGGRTFTIDNPNELTDVATKIGIELRNQYVLGYRPKKPARDGKWRKIKVKLNPPKGLPPLTVYAKTGYYAPTQ